MIPGLNKKGFNLFTALISFLLIMLAVLLVMSMIQSERNTTDTISNMENRSRLEATAEMARADAMQVFNYALRKKIEDWLTDPERGGLTLQLHNKTWDQIQKEFAASKFGGGSYECIKEIQVMCSGSWCNEGEYCRNGTCTTCENQSTQFAKFTASSLEGIFYSPAHFGNYTVSLEGGENLEAGIQAAITKSVDDFFTVIDCPNGDPRTCEKGTFYVNLHIENLTQEEYENLPKLHVVDRATGEELKEIILPRTTFRIYVPLRFFKAIAEARALTHFPLEVEPDSAGDKGLFSPRVHNTIEAMGLGMCDFGYCNPRSNPFEKPAEKTLSGAGTFCPGDSSEKAGPNWGKGLMINLDCGGKPWCDNVLLPGQYNANDNDDWKGMKESIELLAEAKVCNVLKEAKAEGYLDVDPDDKFTLIGNQCGNLAYEISINSDARASKVVGNSESDAILTDPGRNVGLFKDPSTGEIRYPDIGGVEFLSCEDTSSDFKARCAEVKSIKVTLAFREEDPNYMVREAGENEERVYRISVYDNTYLPFTANWEQGEIGADYLYSKEPTFVGCSRAAGAGWYCNTTESGTMENRQSDGCKPAGTVSGTGKKTPEDDDNRRHGSYNDGDDG